MSPTSPQKAPGADGFIQRWLLLEPIDVTGLTDSVVQATVLKEYFPNQFTVIPHDGDKVAAGDARLTWHAVDTTHYNVNLYHFAHALGKHAFMGGGNGYHFPERDFGLTTPPKRENPAQVPDSALSGSRSSRRFVLVHWCPTMFR
jgi:hypothetical protein